MNPEALARALLDDGAGLPADLVGEPRLALAWALKDACLAAWNTDPHRAGQAAQWLRELPAPGAGWSGRQEAEARALADWAEGVACLTRGQMQRAVQACDAAAQGFRQLQQAHHAAQTQVSKIAALSMLGQHDEATACAEALLPEFLAQGDLNAAGKVSLNLGSLHLRRDAYADSARHYRQAAVYFARVGERKHSVMADIGLGGALTAMGDYDEALRICARAGMRAQTHDFPVLQALAAESQGLLHLVRGQFRDALAGLELARRQYESMAMPQYLAIAEKQLADAYLALRLLPEAIALYEPALARFESLALPDEQAWALVQLGRAEAQQGDAQAADSHLGRAAGIFFTQGNPVGQATVDLARAELALARQAPRIALAMARRAATGLAQAGLVDGELRACALAAQALGDGGHWRSARRLLDSTLERARELRLRPVQGQCLTGQGLAAAAAGNAASADACFREAILLFEEQQRALPDDGLRSAFLGLHLRPYRERLRLALAAPSPDAATVLRRLDRFRARSTGRGGAPGADDDPVARDLRTRANWLLRNAQRQQEDGDSAVVTLQALRETEDQLLEHNRRQRLAAGLEAVDPGHDAELDLAGLQAGLADDEALLEYGVLDDELFACIVTRDAISLHRHLARWPAVLQALQGLGFQMDALRHGLAPVRAHLPRLTARTQAHLQRLHGLVWAPLAPTLSGVARVLVVPHGPLAALPFAALADEQGSLVERHQFALAANARAAAAGLGRSPVPARRALVLGESSRLPHAGHEARHVASLFEQQRCAVGVDASLALLREHAGETDVLHLACHAQFRADNPMFSALHLHDEALTVEGAAALQLRPGTVVLSACETALADTGAADDAVGLVGAFLAGGAARVLASLWPVDDEATAGFMTAFYQALQSGRGHAAALQHAQLATRQTHPHPCLWGAFVLHGGW